MRHFKWLWVMLVVAVGFPVSASSQVCGDADGSNTVSMGDLALLTNYLSGIPFNEPSLQADCDNRQGITVSDMEVIAQYIFQGAPLSVFIDTTGTIRYYHVGYTPGDEKKYEEAIGKILPPQ